MQWVLIIFFLIVIPVLLSLIIPLVITRKASLRLRIKCVTCKYCRNKTMYSGRYPNGFPERRPNYCRLQRKWLSGGPSLRCSLKNPSEEFYEDANETYYPKDKIDVYFSAYGDCYHSTLRCPAVKNSRSMRQSPICPWDRRPCPKCWVIKDGHLIPKNTHY